MANKVVNCSLYRTWQQEAGLGDEQAGPVGEAGGVAAECAVVTKLVLSGFPVDRTLLRPLTTLISRFEFNVIILVLSGPPLLLDAEQPGRARQHAAAPGAQPRPAGPGAGAAGGWCGPPLPHRPAPQGDQQ